LLTKVPLIYAAEVLAEVEIPLLDIQTSGFPDELLIRNMTPRRWVNVSEFLAGGPLKDPDKKACTITVPALYAAYDDVSAVVKVPTSGAKGPVTPSEFLAQLKDVPGHLPLPLRVQRMMDRDGARTSSLRFVFNTQRDRNIWTSHKRLSWKGYRCEITTFRTSTPLLAPDLSKERFKNKGRHGSD
jgi:hypothetical protein